MSTQFQIVITAVLLGTMSCSKGTKVLSFKQSGLTPASDMKISTINPVAAKPGDLVTITGQGLSRQSQVKIGDTVVELTESDGTSAKFIMPETPRAGAFKITVGRQSDPTGRVDAPAKYMLADSAGDDYPIYMAKASEICSPVGFRDANGDLQVGTKDCGAGKISDCVADGVVGCVTTSTYKSANLANLSPANVKQGVTIAGTNGGYQGVAPDPWDVRVGKLVNGVTGKLKVNCRNLVQSNVFNYDGSITSIVNDGVTGGGTIDIWDTIDDAAYDYGIDPVIVTEWGSNTDCVVVGEADSDVWTDVTTTSGNIASSCVHSAERCTMKDRITGLWWSSLRSSDKTWSVALNVCDNLSYNDQSDWRLPTQKELMEAYTHGIRYAASDNWITDEHLSNSNYGFMSSSTFSEATAEAWTVSLKDGFTTTFSKGNTGPSFVCVRP